MPRLFIPNIQFRRLGVNPERFHVFEQGCEFSDNKNGFWIESNSTAHSLALLLGFEPYTELVPETATYDRNGRVSQRHQKK